MQRAERLRAFDANGSEVADVERDGSVATGEVLGNRPRRVLQWHLPATELDELRAKRFVNLPQRALFQVVVIGGYPAMVDGGRADRAGSNPLSSAFSSRLAQSLR